MGYFRIISDGRPLGFGMKRARLHQVLEAQRFALILKVQERSLESMSRKIRTRHCAAYMLTEDAFEEKDEKLEPKCGAYGDRQRRESLSKVQTEKGS